MFRHERWIIVQDWHNHRSPGTLKVLYAIATGRVRRECWYQECCLLRKNWIKTPYCLLGEGRMCRTTFATPTVPVFSRQWRAFMYHSQPKDLRCIIVHECHYKTFTENLLCHNESRSVGIVIWAALKKYYGTPGELIAAITHQSCSCNLLRSTSLYLKAGGHSQWLACVGG